METRMKKSVVFILIALFFTVAVFFFYQTSQSTPSYMQEYMQTAIENQSVFVISQSGDAFTIKDEKTGNTFFVSPSSSIDVASYVGKPIALQGQFEHVNSVSFADDGKQVSSVALRIDSASVVAPQE